SLDSRGSISFPSANQATGILLVSLAGLPPAEHASLAGHTTVPLSFFALCFDLLQKNINKFIGFSYGIRAVLQ
ncbi:MAG: hypothetical protein U9N81_10460, partial [Bacillota bacterium]|nr:hypothetical protein [Bacillota bacterium]